MSTNWTKDMAKMHEHFGVKEVVNSFDEEKLKHFLDFRINFLQEELDELKNSKTSEDAVDSLIDLCVIAVGTLDLFNSNAQKAWNKVFHANMKKEAGVNPSRPNEFGLPDLVKPKGWRSPNHRKNTGLFDKLFGEK